ncbi:hypothetical protein, partial [Nocardioides sp.]|uniref:hypothetical protein n=1 Tax=Nocardioides sp. TaxID=35761 RepID=UPI002C1AB0BE
MSGSLRKIVVFLLVGAGAFALAFGLGQLVGDETSPAGHGGHASEKPAPRYSVKLADSSLEAGEVELRLSVLDADGEPVTEYDVVHEKELHLIVVDREYPEVYQHLHPTFADREWSVRTRLLAGDYRVYADTTPTGAVAQVLTADLAVAGDSRPRVARTEPNDTASVDGFDVALEADGSTYTFTVTKAGQPVELEPYLGAGGHLVGTRRESLEYLHAHAMDAQRNTVGFHVEAPRSGTWVL